MTRKTNEGAVGVIAGTGASEYFTVLREKRVVTGYGEAVAYSVEGGSYYLLPRHGPRHGVPPHMVNYRANIECLRRLGVGRVIATSAVGSMDPGFRVGQLGLVGQFLDFTKRRVETYFDKEVRHTDMTNPYSETMNGTVSDASRDLGVKLKTGLVYVCVDGPRFETAAEIKMFRLLGGDVVGMTGVPEVVLAREAGLEYSALAVATNWAAGIQQKVSHDEVVSVMKKTGPMMKRLIEASIQRLEGGSV